jgi:uncharacterized protein (TIGR02594 family)
MVQLVAFRVSLRIVRSLRIVSPRVVALALCSAAIIASAAPASARSHYSPRSHYSRGRQVHRHYAGWHQHYRHYRHVARASGWDAGVAQMRSRGLADSNASLSSGASGASASGFGSSDVVSEARRYIGGNPTGRGRLWCARFMNMVLEHTGHHGTGSDMANSFARYGQRVSGPQVGAIAVMGRRGGGHVGVVSGIDSSGNPIVVSGNNGNRVREAPISRGRISAYVMPAG